MNKLILAATLAIVATAGLTPLVSRADAKAAPKYDCTKPGNANKAACKAAAATAASTTTTLAAKPAAKLTTSKATTLASAPATTTSTTTTTAQGGSMKACATQWGGLSAAQKAVYNTQATTMKSKAGGKLSGYNVFTGQCLKKK